MLAGEEREQRRQSLARNHLTLAHHFQSSRSDAIQRPLILRRGETQDEPTTAPEMGDRSPCIITHITAQFETSVGFLGILRNHSRPKWEIGRTAGDEREFPF